MKTQEYKKMFLLEDKHFWFLGKRALIKILLNQHVPNKNLFILDIGCGTGGLTKFLTHYGKVIGLEKNKYAVNLAKKRGLKIINGDAQKLPFKRNSFSLVTLFDVLYHKNIKDEKMVIKEVNRVLKNNGYFLITDSAFNFLKSTHDRAVFGNKRFTLPYLKNILEKEGFKIIKSSYCFFLLFPLIFIKRKILDKLIKNNDSDLNQFPKIINWFLTKVVLFEAWLLKYIDFPIGSSLVILAKKIN